MDCSPLGSSVHGICQARVLKWVAIAFSSNSIYVVSIYWLKMKYIYSLYWMKTSAQFSNSVTSNSLCPWTATCQASPSYHQLPEFTKIHLHWVGDAIQTSHPLSTSSAPAFNLSEPQGLLKWVSSWHQVAKVLKFQLQHQCFQWIFRTDIP